MILHKRKQPKTKLYLALSGLLFAGLLLTGCGSNTPTATLIPVGVTPTVNTGAAPGAGSSGNVVTTTSGLKYIDSVVGTGATAEKGKTVSVHYTGYLKDGTKFDSSLDRGQPFDFPLGGGRVIKGWDEGVAGMKIGGKRRLIIPSNLGYGAQGAGGGLIPPNAELTFDVELLAVK